jgi:hypothetical protein
MPVSKIIIILMLIGSSMMARAAQSSEFSDSDLSTVEAGKQKKINVKFGDEFVKGQEEHPSAEYMFERKQFNFKKMIQLRENFIPEVEKGKDDFGGF